MATSRAFFNQYREAQYTAAERELLRSARSMLGFSDASRAMEMETAMRRATAAAKRTNAMKVMMCFQVVDTSYKY